MASLRATLSKCPECGYETVSFLTRCPLCRATLLEQDAPSREALSPERLPPAESNRFSFSLSTLMLVLTLACVGMGGIVAVPGLAIPLIVIAFPAMARTWATGRREIERGGSWRTADKIAALAVSMGVMLLISAAGCIAFCVACFAGCWGAIGLAELTKSSRGGGPFGPDWIFPFAIGFGVLAGVGLMIYLMWKNWPASER